MLKTARVGEQYCAGKTGHDRINHHRDGYRGTTDANGVATVTVTQANALV